MTDIVPIQHALLSCSDRTGLEPLVKKLATKGVRLIASGGTAQFLRELQLTVIDVESWTGQPEILGGRVKTLHPRIHAPILFRRDEPEDVRTIQQMGLPGIDLVICNLYPFDVEPSIETIDIGGPTLLRAAAKNHSSVTVLSSPDQYTEFLSEWAHFQGTRLGFRQRCAARVFQHMSYYDGLIADYLSDVREFRLQFPSQQHLRYGENPQQKAELFYPEMTTGIGQSGLPYTCLQGKELSYNNLLDLQSAVQLAFQARAYFGDQHTHCVVVKHQNPCGFGRHKNAEQAYALALEGDPEAAFGGIVGLDVPVTRVLAEKISALFLEVVVAPSFDDEAVEIFSKKKNLRLVRWNGPSTFARSIRSFGDGLLVQSEDGFEAESDWKVVTSRVPTSEEREAARLAWYVCRFVKSNAVVAGTKERILAVGAGQMSRIDSLRILQRKLEGKTEVKVKWAVASDAFFPFRDAVDLLSECQATCVIQPGGSVRDAEVIQACEEHHLSLIVTGRRHFYH